MVVTLLLGFSSGLPLVAIGGTLQAWMRGSGIDLAKVGLVSLLSLPYSLKFLWAPLMDRFALPILGRRRGWMLATQCLLGLSFAGLSACDPVTSQHSLFFWAFVIAFFSASQDIVLDAHRRDMLDDRELGLGSGIFVTGYRIGMLASGAGALWLADQIAWSSVYQILALAMATGIIATLLAPDPVTPPGSVRTLREAVVVPIVEFFTRHGVRFALLSLFFVLMFKFGDSIATSITTPYFLDVGFTKTQIAEVAKFFGLIATIVGGILGGWIVFRVGIYKALWICGVLQGISTLVPIILLYTGPSVVALAFAVSSENLIIGMGTSAYAAFLGSLCDKRFSASQYALLSSLMSLPRTLFAGGAGAVADVFGYQRFFIFCACAAVPGLALLKLLRSTGWNANLVGEATSK